MALLVATVFEDPAWVAVIVAAVAVPVGVAVPFLIARWQTGRKALGYGTTAASLVRDTARGRLTVLFADREVSSVALITVTLVNIGTQPIRREDFDGPLRIRYGDLAEVLDAEVHATEPAGLSPELSIPAGGTENDARAQRFVEIAPLLLNSRDSLSIEALVDRHDGLVESVTVEGRIAGIKEVKRVDEDAVSTASLIAVAAQNAAVASVLTLIPGARFISSGLGLFGRAWRR